VTPKYFQIVDIIKDLKFKKIFFIKGKIAKFLVADKEFQKRPNGNLAPDLCSLGSQHKDLLLIL
jgi:hypothetical protein